MADLMGERPAAPQMARGGGVDPGIIALVSALQSKIGPQGLMQLLTMLLQQGGGGQSQSQMPPQQAAGPPPQMGGMGMMGG